MNEIQQANRPFPSSNPHELVSWAQETPSAEAAIWGYMDRREAIETAVELFRQGHHCGEVVLRCGGPLVWEDFDPRIARMGTGWAGGVAHAEDLCGALAAGVMLIGAKHGRITLDDDDVVALAKVRRFREAFRQAHGSLHCRDIRVGPFCPAAHEACTAVVRQAMEALFDVLEDDEDAPAT